MQGKRAEAPAVAALARWPTSRRLPDLSRGQPAAREASYFKARRTAPRNLVCFCERKKKKKKNLGGDELHADTSAPRGTPQGRGRMMGIAVRLGAGGLLIGRAQGLLLSVCAVLCTASALHCLPANGSVLREGCTNSAVMAATGTTTTRNVIFVPSAKFQTSSRQLEPASHPVGAFLFLPFPRFYCSSEGFSLCQCFGWSSSPT